VLADVAHRASLPSRARAPWDDVAGLAADAAAGARLAGCAELPRRCWRAWSNAPMPPELQDLLDWVAAGRPLDLYHPP
jgi:hypothetical protein